MSNIYFAGLKASKIVNKNETRTKGTILAMDKFNRITGKGVTDVEIGWDYILIWRNTDLFISGKIVGIHGNEINKLLQLPEDNNIKFKQAIASPGKVTVLTDTHQIWIYNILNDTWMEGPNFLHNKPNQRVIKIDEVRCIVGLTDTGHVYSNKPNVIIIPPSPLKIVDVACGLEHTILLGNNGHVYSVAMGTRIRQGQLGHGDQEVGGETRLIIALSDLKVVQISAGAWHSAVVTDQGHLYTWGANNQGQLGHPNIKNFLAVPKSVEFKRADQEIIRLNINKVQCGYDFTICRTDTNNLWVCGSNKYGQLGFNKKRISSVKEFTLINPTNIKKPIKDFKCREQATCIFTE